MIFAYSIIIDIIWVIFIYFLIINTNEYDSLANFERGIQKCTFIVMWINLVVKVGSLSDSRLLQLSCRYSSILRSRARETPVYCPPEPELPSKLAAPIINEIVKLSLS